MRLLLAASAQRPGSKHGPPSQARRANFERETTATTTATTTTTTTTTSGQPRLPHSPKKQASIIRARSLRRAAREGLGAARLDG